MQYDQYKAWLEMQYQANTVTAQLHRAGRVEQYYGDLDEHYDRDALNSIIEAFVYTADDRRRNRPNETLIPFEGNVYNNLASYRNAVSRYQRFRLEPNLTIQASEERSTDENHQTAPETQRFGLERDMQSELRARIEQLEPGLEIIDDGAERSVGSGFIDITAKDSSGSIVVIELKTGVASQRAIAQILSYMGDIMDEEEAPSVTGILIASDFDKKAKAAARVIPNLSLKKYNVQFTFSNGIDS